MVVGAAEDLLVEPVPHLKDQVEDKTGGKTEHQHNQSPILFQEIY